MPETAVAEKTAPEDWPERIKDREKELEDLYTRMDRDRKLYQLEAFELKDLAGEKITSVRNLTLNDPATYAKRVTDALMGATPQTVVTGKGMKKLADKKTTVVEQFLNNYFMMADERLANLGIAGGLDAAIDGQLCIRGGAAVRSAPHMDDDGEFAPDIMIWDRRYVSWESGPKGLEWANYRTERGKAQIKQLYGLDVVGDTGKVLDLWTPTDNFIYIDEVLKDTQPHTFGFVPVIIEACPTSAFLRDEGWIAHDGESIYATVRDLYEALNQLATVLNTINMRAFQGSLQTQTEDPAKFNLEDSPFDERQLIPLKVGEKIELIPIADIKRATLYLLQLIEQRLQRGSLAATDYGNLNFPLSAVAIKTLSEARNSLLVPLIHAKSMLKSRLSKMLTRQWIDGAFEAYLGQEGEEVSYSPAELEGTYKITYKYFPVTPVENIANYAVADVAREYLDEEKVLEEILHVQDPHAVIMKRRSERADKVIPELDLLHMAMAKVDEGLPLEAALIAGKLGLSLEELKAGEVDEKKVMQGLSAPGGEGGPRGKQLVDVFGRQGGKPGARSSQQESAEMEATMEAS